MDIIVVPEKDFIKVLMANGKFIDKSIFKRMPFFDVYDHLIKPRRTFFAYTLFKKKIVGLALVWQTDPQNLTYTLPKDHGEYKIEFISVDPNHLGKGIGDELRKSIVHYIETEINGFVKETQYSTNDW